MSRRTGRRVVVVAGGGDPDQGSELVSWYRSDQGITLNVTTVSSWADISGHGVSAVQATGSAQPLFVAADPLFAGFPSLRFTAASSQSLVGAGFTVAQPDTIYLVVAFTAAGVNSVAIDGTSARQLVGHSPVNTYEFYAGGSVLTGGTTDLVAHVLCATFTNTATSFLYVDNTTTAAVSGNAGNSALTGINLGGIAGEFLQGSMAESRVYSGAHAADQRQAIMKSLGNRYGIAVA